MRAHRRTALLLLGAVGLLKDIRRGLVTYSSAEIYFNGVKLEEGYASVAEKIRPDHVALKSRGAGLTTEVSLEMTVPASEWVRL